MFDSGVTCWSLLGVRWLSDGPRSKYCSWKVSCRRMRFFLRSPPFFSSFSTITTFSCDVFLFNMFQLLTDLNGFKNVMVSLLSIVLKNERTMPRTEQRTRFLSGAFSSLSSNNQKFSYQTLKTFYIWSYFLYPIPVVKQEVYSTEAHSGMPLTSTRVNRRQVVATVKKMRSCQER